MREADKQANKQNRAFPPGMKMSEFNKQSNVQQWTLDFSEDTELHVTMSLCIQPLCTVLSTVYFYAHMQ